MDEALRDDDDGTLAAPRQEPGMPPEAPGPMPSQPLTRFDASSRRAPADPARARSPAWRRVGVLGASLALDAYAVEEMTRALAVGHLTVVASTVLLLFAVNFSWISLPLVTSLVGFVRLLARRGGAVPADHPLST